MNRHWTVKRGLASTVLPVFLGLFWATSPSAVAQQADEAMEAVAVVTAPIERRYEGRTVWGPIQVTELKRSVSYADLELSAPADVTTLESRIEIVARESCEKLSRMIPFGDRTDVRRCIKQAVQGTEEQVKAARSAKG